MDYMKLYRYIAGFRQFPRFWKPAPAPVSLVARRFYRSESEIIPHLRILEREALIALVGSDVIAVSEHK